MSAIAGIFRPNGADAAPEEIRHMTSAMAHRGPDGIHHWASGPVALGHCMLCTTPEALHETQPWADPSEKIILVMDGRVDNVSELRHSLLQRGAVLRNNTDAELVLRAYETWGDGCPDRIIGEFVFFIWDGFKRELFGARDAVGTRHFYYHWGKQLFAFASEIKGLLTLGEVPRRLNEARLLDNIVHQYDRDDTEGTFYQDIYRLPAGHAMRASKAGIKTWRYWNPGELQPLKFSSMDECAEAFLEQLRIAVKCRLRSSHPVGALLSGGLDSSSVVGLIRKEFRGDLAQPLRTYTLAPDAVESSGDWRAVQEIVKGGWIESTVVTPSVAASFLDRMLEEAASHDEPFMWTACLPESCALEMARQDGCRVVLEGMAGDLLFYNGAATEQTIFHERKFSLLPAYIRSARNHGTRLGWGAMAYRLLAQWTPEFAYAPLRRLKSRGGRFGTTPAVWNTLRMLHPHVSDQLARKKQAQAMGTTNWIRAGNNQRHHATKYTGGLISFALESQGEFAMSLGVETRSPHADRRLVEFAIRMPVEAKMILNWYKAFLRTCMAGVLPAPVVYRSTVGEHPGRHFWQHLLASSSRHHPWATDVGRVANSLEKWVSPKALDAAGADLFRLALLARWTEISTIVD
jgi:asparagine synthase (glutamine-hydrolysing)